MVVPKEIWLALSMIAIVFTVAHFAMEYGEAPGVGGRAPVFSSID